jgi:hypothetical protein
MKKVKDPQSSFTCPYCGGVFGLSTSGKVGMFSYKIYRSHVDKCEKKPKLCKNC